MGNCSESGTVSLGGAGEEEGFDSGDQRKTLWGDEGGEIDVSGVRGGNLTRMEVREKGEFHKARKDGQSEKESG